MFRNVFVFTNRNLRTILWHEAVTAGTRPTSQQIGVFDASGCGLFPRFLVRLRNPSFSRSGLAWWRGQACFELSSTFHVLSHGLPKHHLTCFERTNAVLDVRIGRFSDPLLICFLLVLLCDLSLAATVRHESLTFKQAILRPLWMTWSVVPLATHTGERAAARRTKDIDMLPWARLLQLVPQSRRCARVPWQG